MKQLTMTRNVEPFLHIIPAAIALWYAIPRLLDNGYNPGFLPWCGLTPEPHFCNKSEEYECERGASSNVDDAFIVRMMLFMVSTLLCFLFLAILCFKVFQLKEK